MATNPRRKSSAARRANQVIRNRTVLLMAVFGVLTFVVLFFCLLPKALTRWARGSVSTGESQEKATLWLFRSESTADTR